MTATDLWIGAPGRTVAGRAGAGAIAHYTLTAAGRFRFLESLSQASPAAHDRAAAGRRFGAILAVGAAGRAGRVGAGETVNQNTLGVPGAAETGDHFGAWVVNGSLIGVGVPDEDVGSVRDAGLVDLFVTGSVAPLQQWNADSEGTAGVPGAVAPGNRFGAALSSGVGEDSGGDLWIGAPGQTVDGAVGAGAVIEAGYINAEDRRTTRPRGTS